MLERLNNLFIKVFLIIFDLEKLLSVTNNGLDIFKSLQANPKFLMLFSPTNILVG